MHSRRSHTSDLRRIALRVLVSLKALALCLMMTPALMVTAEIGLGLKVTESSTEAPLENLELHREVTPSQLARRVNWGRPCRSAPIVATAIPTLMYLSDDSSQYPSASTRIAAGLCSRLRC